MPVGVRKVGEVLAREGMLYRRYQASFSLVMRGAADTVAIGWEPNSCHVGMGNRRMVYVAATDVEYRNFSLAALSIVSIGEY